MHKLLMRQLRRFLNQDAVISPEWQRLLEEIDHSYEHADEDRTLLERSLELTSSELTKYNQQLRAQAQSALMFQKAVEYSTDAIAIIGEKGIMIYVNPAWEQLTGFSKDESIGKTIEILRSDKTSVGLAQELQTAVLEHKEFHSEEVIHKRKNGEDFHVALTLYPIKSEEPTPLLVMVQQDITTRKIADASKSEFVSLASHQLRTPLTSIIWNLELLQGTDLAMLSKDQLDVLLQSAHRSSKRMAETIDTLLQLSKLEVGKIQPNFTFVEVAPLLETVRSEQLSEYVKKQLAVAISCPPDLTVTTDPIILKEVLSNLLNNAIKYTPVKGNITFYASKENDQVTIKIQDTGYGIPAAQQEKVFSKFFRGANVIYIENTGNGLGLYLVHELMRLLRGSITFQSEENKGTTFSMNLPKDPKIVALAPEVALGN